MRIQALLVVLLAFAAVTATFADQTHIGPSKGLHPPTGCARCPPVG